MKFFQLLSVNYQLNFECYDWHSTTEFNHFLDDIWQTIIWIMEFSWWRSIEFLNNLNYIRQKNTWISEFMRCHSTNDQLKFEIIWWLSTNDQLPVLKLIRWKWTNNWEYFQYIRQKYYFYVFWNDIRHNFSFSEKIR